jgi:hypothetical protein
MVLTTLTDSELATPGYPGMNMPWYNERAVDSDTLTITVGDSWTWGDSLDYDHRQTQIYGNLLAEKFNSDFINIGLCGGSNLHILKYLDRVLSHLAKEYKTIRVFLP